MLFTLGLALLFFLPVIESFNRQIAINLLLTGSVLIGLTTFWKKKLSFDFIELLMLLMLLMFTLSTTLSWSLSRSYFELLRYFAYFLIFVSVRRFADIQLLLKRYFIPMIIVNSFLLALITIVYFLPIFRFAPPKEGMNLFYPVFGHNHLSDLLLFTLPIMISLISTRLRANNNILYIIAGIFFLMIFVLTMARGAMLALVFALFIYVLYINKDKRWYPWILLISSVTAVFLVFSFVFSNFLVGPEKGKQFPKFIYKNAVSENRPIYFQQAVNNFVANPVFGSGLDTFRYVSRMNSTQKSGWSWYVHNQFLQIFTETGFLGGLLFSILIITFLISALKKVNHQLSINNYQSQSLFIALLASIFHSLIDFDWQFLSIFLFFWLSAGLLLPKKAEETRSKNYFWLLLIMVISIFYLFQFIIPLDIDKLLAKTDKTSISQAYRLDTKNIDIVKKLAQLETKAENYDQAHYWYRTAIFLTPLESSDSIKQDALLYIAQIKKSVADKNINLSMTYFKTMGEAYPFYFQVSSGDYYLVNAYKMNNLKDKFKTLQFIKEYTTVAQRKLSSYKLNPLELQATVENLKNLKTIY